MGYSSYSTTDRATRTVTYCAATSVDQIFTQQAERKAHADMSPANVVVRECKDSEAHPNTVPIQLYLDVTGSMGHIPHEMIKTGLPTLMSTLIQSGVTDASLMFGAIGDHECDSYPLQVGQFESGDAELDMWLTRTYLEGKGGGNAGESYLLAWYFAAFHTTTDSFVKRGRKGFVFTVGDEPTLKSLPQSALKGIMRSTAVGESTYSASELYAAASQQNHVFHIHINHGSRKADPYFKELLGSNFLELNDHTQLPQLLSVTILNFIEVHQDPETDIAPELDVVDDSGWKQEKITL